MENENSKTRRLPMFKIGEPLRLIGKEVWIRTVEDQYQVCADRFLHAGSTWTPVDSSETERYTDHIRALMRNTT